MHKIHNYAWGTKSVFKTKMVSKVEDRNTGMPSEIAQKKRSRHRNVISVVRI